MKINFFLVASIGYLFTGCGNESTETTTVPPQKDTAVLQTEVTDSLPVTGFEADWNQFKSAVSTNNWDEFKIFIGPDVTDPEQLLVMLQEDWVLTKLTDTGYEALTVSDYNGTAVKEFSAEVSGSDDEGNIYESAIFLYFEESVTGLKLVNVLMAG